MTAVGTFGTYLVPNNETTSFWREGKFTIDTQVLWSYAHTHGGSTEELLFYVGADATTLRMNETMIGSSLKSYDRTQVEHAKAIIARAADDAGAELVCHLRRDSRALELEPAAAARAAAAIDGGAAVEAAVAAAAAPPALARAWRRLAAIADADAADLRRAAAGDSPGTVGAAAEAARSFRDAALRLAESVGAAYRAEAAALDGVAPPPYYA